MSLQPVSPSPQRFDTNSPLSLSIRVGSDEHLSPQEILKRALMQALNLSEAAAQSIISNSGIQLTASPERQQFDQHAVYSITPPPSFWQRIATFLQNASDQTTGTGQQTTSISPIFDPQLTTSP